MLRDSQIAGISNGRTFGYAEYGDPGGRLVLALHGAPACRLMFAAADTSAKAHGLRIFAPDRPGYGLTPSERPATLASRTAWLTEVVDALRLDRFAVLGISGGSPYAVALAAALPERVEAMALVSPMGPVADYSDSAEAKLDPVSFLHDRFFMHLPYRSWLAHPMGDVGAWLFRHGPDMFTSLLPRLASSADAPILAKPEVASVMRDMTLEAFRQGGRGGTDDLEIFGRSWGLALESVHTPTVIWQGSNDHVVPPQVSRWLAGRLGNCTLHSLHDQGHFWVFEHVDEVVATLDGLIAGDGKGIARI